VIDSPVIGPRSLEHLKENADARSISLSASEIERLEEPKTPV
jgi:aryl-alcohol dehydrogenase-like predicted oxidoreductase